MLDLGFEQDVRDIIGYCAGAGERQTAMFSATWPKSIRDLAAEFLTNPVKVRYIPLARLDERTGGYLDWTNGPVFALVGRTDPWLPRFDERTGGCLAWTNGPVDAVVG